MAAKVDFKNSDIFLAGVKSAAANAVRNLAEDLQADVQRTMGRGARGTPSPPGSPPNRQTGGLARAIVVEKAGDLHFRVGTNLVYGKIHEFGGVVRAKSGSLAVPVHRDAKRYSEIGLGPRDMANLVFVKRPGKAPILIRENAGRGKKQRGARTEVMYVLLKSVRIPARPFLAPAAARARVDAQARFRRYFGRAIRQFASNLQGPGGAG